MTSTKFVTFKDVFFFDINKILVFHHSPPLIQANKFLTDFKEKVKILLS